ncbi:MAG: serine dehydratase [Lentisphaerae bacterium GWF2_38_69]|nr:MAG: serine dehydratase [Lentisphaerae bacterium GWF2_38_69]
MGPARSAKKFKEKYPKAASFKVTLGGSLALTGKGHFTDKAIIDTFAPNPVEIIWQPNIIIADHPNGFIIDAYDSNGFKTASITDISLGGGALKSDGESGFIYKHKYLREIMEYCTENNIPYWSYVEEVEGSGIWDYLRECIYVMRDSMIAGLKGTGLIPGPLKLPRKAGTFKNRSLSLNDDFGPQALTASYAYAVAEVNASGGIVVTAPTCGSCGVLPAILATFHKKYNTEIDDLLHAMATAAIFGNIAKHNGSISGAVAGCQAEIGVACAMAAAATTQLMGGTLEQIEYAAEMGLEHHLGLTCDPVMGLVQIPCIERNAHAALRAYNCANFALLSDGKHRISYDNIVKVLIETGKNLSSLYRETSTGGLATVYNDITETNKG